MTPPSRYRGLPVSDGIGPGPIYLADAPGPGHDRSSGRGRCAGRLRRGRAARRAGCPATRARRGASAASWNRRTDRRRPRPLGPASRGAGRRRRHRRVQRPPRPRPPCSPRCPSPSWPSAPVTSARSPRPCRSSPRNQRAPASRGQVHPGPPRDRPARPHPARRQARRWPTARCRQRLRSGLVGAVSVAGGASSHAAIIARGLGLPMLTRIDPGARRAGRASGDPRRLRRRADHRPGRAVRARPGEPPGSPPARTGRPRAGPDGRR